MKQCRVCLIGAGFISSVHAEAVSRIKNTQLTAIVDLKLSAAERLARQFGVPHAFGSIEELIDAQVADVCHVLLPPPLHGSVVKQLIAAGLDVLVEKPVTIDGNEAFELANLVSQQKRIVGVNHNAIWFPAFSQLLKFTDQNKLGKLLHVDCCFMAQLRQLDAGQFGHWMFAEAKNILLEQAVHPLSQIQRLIGKIEDFQAIRGESIRLPNGQSFFPQISASMKAELASAQFHFKVGVEFPVWRITAICEDGLVEADLISGQLSISKKSRYLDAMDHWLLGIRKSARYFYRSSLNLINYALSLSGVKERSDSFYTGIKNSLVDYYQNWQNQTTPITDVTFAGQLVQLCESIAAQVFEPSAEIKTRKPKRAKKYDVLLLGGTGFIGRHTLKQLRSNGMSVAVMARNMTQLDDCFYQPGVSLLQGDIGHKADIDKAVAGAKYVVNLAHGGASGSYEQIYNAMVGGALLVAQSCLEHRVKQLIHVGSIAGLYLGDNHLAITANTQPDPLSDERGDYARAKAEADRELMKMHHDKQLPLVLMRPGVVIGQGGIPFHSGIGLFNNTQHCIGWNAGQNALPFVLVEDVAGAIVQCIKLELKGKTYNLVGDVPLSAKEYILQLGKTLHRPLKFHSQNVIGLYLMEWFKWAVKRIARRKVAAPSLRDFKSRGMVAPFDCSIEKQELQWQPENDRQRFIERGIGCYKQ